MKYFIAFILMIVSLEFVTPTFVMGREIEPIVSVDWLEKNLKNPELVVIDVRKVEDYSTGHIPGALNIFYKVLTPGGHTLRNELPWEDDLRDVLTSGGIGSDSLVVVVGDCDWVCGRFIMTRIAMTIMYAGLPNVAVLDGGMNKWAATGKAISKEVVKRKPREYKGEFRKDMFIKKIDVAAGIDKNMIIVDAREPEFYKGTKKLNLVARPGRIKGAVNMPVCSLLFEKSGAYKSITELRKLIVKTVGEDLDRKIVLYCDTGMEATGLWFLMTQVFGYRNVKVYDGSCQEWAEDQYMPMEK